MDMDFGRPMKRNRSKRRLRQAAWTGFYYAATRGNTPSVIAAMSVADQCISTIDPTFRFAGREALLDYVMQRAKSTGITTDGLIFMPDVIDAIKSNKLSLDSIGPVAA